MATRKLKVFVYVIAPVVVIIAITGVITEDFYLTIIPLIVVALIGHAALFDLLIDRFYRFCLVGLFANMFVLIMIFGLVYAEYGLLDTCGNKMSVQKNELSDAVYFSIVTWTTLGYGDLRPTEGVRFVAALEALMGYMYMGLLLLLASRVFVAKDGPDASGALVKSMIEVAIDLFRRKPKGSR